MANNVADMNAVLTVCGFTNQNQRDTIIDEGFASLDDFSILTSDEVSEMAKKDYINATKSRSICIWSH